jgi:hypothetical protein
MPLGKNAIFSEFVANQEGLPFPTYLTGCQNPG